MRHTCLILGVLIVAFITTWYFFFIRAWTNAPCESLRSIDQRWNELEQETQVYPIPCRDVRPLYFAANIIKRSKHPVLRKLLTWEQGKPLNDVELGKLSANIEDALAQFMQWHKQGGGLGVELCKNSLDISSLLALARVSLLSTRDSAHKGQINVTLNLAQSLRRYARLDDAIAGFALATQTLVWAKSNNIFVKRDFHYYQPEAQEVFSALVREIVCSYQMFEDNFTENDLKQARKHFGIFFGPKSIERELLVLRKYFVDLFDRVKQEKNNLAHLARALTLPKQDKLPKSVLVRIAARNLGKYVRDMHIYIRKYNEIMEEV